MSNAALRRCDEAPDEARTSAAAPSPDLAAEHSRPMISIGPSLAPDGNPRQLKTAERVAVEIVRDLVARGARTGDHLPREAAMVGHYGVSRASVREALRLLEAQGLIHLKPGPGGGPVIGSVDPANLARTSSLFFHLGGATYDSVLWTQSLLEPVCAQLAAHHPDRRRVLQRFVNGPTRSSTDDRRRRSEEFHADIHRLAANPIVVLLTQAISGIVRDHVLSTMVGPERQLLTPDRQIELARAIADGQAEMAGRLMAEHLRSRHEYFRRHAPERLGELIEWR